MIQTLDTLNLSWQAICKRIVDFADECKSQPTHMCIDCFSCPDLRYEIELLVRNLDLEDFVTLLDDR